MRPLKRFTLEEREKIEELLSDGYSFKRVALMMDRSPTGIITEVKKNGGREAYRAVKAHGASHVRKLEKIEKLRVVSKDFINPYYSISQRIKALEMQVQILTEIIRKK